MKGNQVKDQEDIYDSRISPLIGEILKVCMEHEMPMFASFQFSKTGFCTSAQEHDGNAVIRWHRALAQCAEGDSVNFDKFMFWVMKQAQGKPHSSVFLMKLGVPVTPEPEPQG